MATGILSVLTLALGILFWWLKRRSVEAADPLEQNRKRYEQIDQDIYEASRGDKDARSGSLCAAAHAGADLDELERLQRGRGNERRSN